MNAKTIVAVVVATALFSGSALAVSGNPENPDASTKNWQLDELRHSMNSQFIDVNNRIDKIQTGSASGAVDQLRSEVNTRFDNVDRDINNLKDQVGNKVDKDDFLKDQQKQNDRMDGMQDRIDNSIGRLDAVEDGLNHAERLLDTVENKLDYTNHLAQGATDKAQEATDAANNALKKADQALKENVKQDAKIAELDATKANRGELKGVADKANEAKKLAEVAADIAVDASNKAEVAEANNEIQDAQIADLQTNKADRSELEDVAIKADGALAGAIENRNQIDAVKDNLANTDKQVIKNKNDIADLKNQNGVLNNAVANAQDTANTASDKADKAQNTADKAVAGVNNVKNDVKVVSRDVANNSIRIQRNEERIDGAYAGIYDNRKNIEANRQAINKNTKAIQQLNRNFNDLRDKVERNNKDMKRGVAGAAALAGMPQVGQYGDFMVSAGVGYYKGETAVAVGASGRINSNVVVKSGVAFTSGEAVINGGVGIAW